MDMANTAQVRYEMDPETIYRERVDRTRAIMEEMAAAREREAQPKSGRQQAYEAGVSRNAYDPLADVVNLLTETVEERNARNTAQTLQEQGATELQNPAVRAPAAGESTPEAAAAEDAAAAAPDTPRNPPGGGGGSGSGSSGGATSYEQAITDAIARADKRATQDKWLALAQAGMALMASKQPTLGGALGEAGASGLAAFRQSRDEAEKTKMDLMGTQFEIDLARQKLAASGGGGGRGLSAKSIFDIFGKRVENAQIAFENARLSGDKGAMLEAKNRLEAATADYEGLYAQLGATQIVPEEDEVRDVTE